MGEDEQRRTGSCLQRPAGAVDIGRPEESGTRLVEARLGLLAERQEVVLCCCHEVRESDAERERLRKRCVPRGRPVREEAENGEELSSAGCLVRRTSRLWLTPHQNGCMAVQCRAFLLIEPQPQADTAALNRPERLAPARVCRAAQHLRPLVEWGVFV